MDKFTLSFAISHLDKAIWNLECANKLDPGSVPKEVIENLRTTLSEKRQELWGGEKKCEDM